MIYKSARTQDAGFSLIELMATIAIMGIIMAIAIPSFSSWRERTAAKSASDTLMAHMKHARIKALAESRCVAVGLNIGSLSYDVDGLQVPLSQYSNNLTMSTTIGTTTKAFIFRSDGTAGSNTCASFNPTAGSVTIASSESSHTITVNAIGRAYFQ